MFVIDRQWKLSAVCVLMFVIGYIYGNVAPW